MATVPLMLAVAAFLGPAATPAGWAEAGGDTGQQALQTLMKSVEAYSALKSYVGTTKVYCKGNAFGQDLDKIVEARIVYVRPGKVRLEGMDLVGRGYVVVAADGATVWQSWPGVAVFRRLSDAELAMTEIMLVTARAPALSVVFEDAKCENPLSPLTQARLGKARLERREPVDGADCDKVVSETLAGPLTLWIDRKTHLLRQAKEQLTLGDGRAELLHSFRVEQLNGPVDEQLFADPIEEQKRLVAAMPPRPYLDAEKAALYRKASNELRGEKPNPDEALKTLGDLRAKAPDNGFTTFLAAAAWAKKGDWDAVARELETGARARRCLEYMAVDGPLRLNFGLSHLRGLARDCAAAAPGLGADKGAQLLQSVRAMAKRLAGAEPLDAIHPLVAAAIRSIADKALVELYEKAGRAADAEQSRKLQTADEAWRENLRADLRTLPWGEDSLTYLTTKHGITREEIERPADQPMAEETKLKVAAYVRELNAAECPRVENWVKAMPE